MMLDLTSQHDVITQTMRSWLTRDSEPEDMAQDIWVRLVEVKHLYDPKRGEVAAFVNRVCRSVWVTRMRYHGAQKRTEAEDVLQDTFHTHKGQGRTFKTYLRETLDLDDIEPRRVYVLLAMGYTRNEICECMDMTLYQVNQLKGRLRALAEDYLSSPPEKA